MTKPKVIGKLEFRDPKQFKPNSWNPNSMSEHTRQSVLLDLRENGWLVAQAMTVWGKDDKGKARNLIIDAEHRHACALELGFDRVPVVVLDGLTAAQAKAWTLKLGRRGEYKEPLLAALVNDLQSQLDVPDLGMELGLPDDRLLALLAYEPELEAVAGEEEEAPDQAQQQGKGRSASNHVKMVQLFYDVTQHREFQAAVEQLGKRYGKNNISEALLEAVRELTGTVKPKAKNGASKKSAAGTAA